MKLHRISALLIRNLYLYKRSLPRIMDIIYWPVVEVLLWGFLSIYIERLNLGGFNAVSVLLGAVIFWTFIDQSQKAISISFLEEVWERNFLNIFVTPLRISEFLSATVLIGFIRVVLTGAVMAVLAFLLYHFNIFALGFFLIPFILLLSLFGWTVGLFSIAIILRYGSSAQIFAWGIIVLVQPFSAVFYPVSVLPQALQYVAYALPTTYIFEGMRAVIATGTFPVSELFLSLGVNIVYLAVMLWFFYHMFAYVKREGRLLKLEG